MNASLNAIASMARLTTREIIAAAPLLANWRNSKGRIMPLHLKSAPGVGKNMITEVVVKAMARSMPGVPVGYAVHNPGVMTPADTAGFVLFDTIDGQKSSVYTRPTLFAVKYALAFQADSGEFVRVTLDDDGQPLYVGSRVGGVKLDNGLLLMDEFDQADIEVRKVCAPLLDEGRITTHQLPEGWGVWCASNRARDASGTGRGLAFLTNRVCSIEIEPDVDALEAYLTGGDATQEVTFVTPTQRTLVQHGRVVRDAHNVDGRAHAVVTAYLRQQVDHVYAGVPSDPNAPFLTPRSLEAVSNLFDISLRLLVADESGAMPADMSFAETYISRNEVEMPEGLSGSPIARWRTFQALAAGTIGADNTAQFLACLELFDEVPTIAEIVAAPAKAKVSDKRDAMFIVGYQIANGMTTKNADALMAYAKRLDDAIYHNVAHNAVSRDGSLMMTKSINQFLTDHPESTMRMLSARVNAQVKQRR